MYVFYMCSHLTITNNPDKPSNLEGKIKPQTVMIGYSSAYDFTDPTKAED